MNTEPNTLTLDDFRNYRAGANGTERKYRHALGMVYTDGARILAEAAGAHWLLDVIASHQPAIQRLPGEWTADFQVWRIESGPSGAWSLQNQRPDLSIPKTLDGTQLTFEQVEEAALVVSAWSDTPYGRESGRLVAQVVGYSDLPRSLLPLTLWVEQDTILLPEEH